jgi:hypothetical protein
MDEIVNQQQLREDLDTFDIDEYLLKRKEEIDRKIRDYQIRIQALKLTRNKPHGR